MSTTRKSATACSRWRADERGQAIVFFSLSLVMLLGLTGFVIDYGRVIWARTVLQASSDAAAAAGAQHINESGQNPVSTAIAYSSLSGQKNFRSNLTGVSMVSGYPLLRCLTASGLPPCPVDSSVPSSVANNAIEVRQQVTVPMTFTRVLGINNIVVRARGIAGARGGYMPPLDIVIVLDTTGSMGGVCGSITRLRCAKDGIRTLLLALWPCAGNLANCGAATGGNVANPIDQVGLVVFPPLKPTTAVSQEFDCATNIATTEISPYSTTPNVYTIVPLSSDYRVSTTATVLNGSVSNLAKAVYYGDGAGCGSGAYGVENPGGQGSYFADAISSARTTLLSTGRPQVQDVIIFVSDGDANQYVGGPANPCQLAVNAADVAAANGMWVYSLAYGATSGGCDDDSSSITSYSTMQQIASDNTKFYSVPSSSTLTAAFQKIGEDLTTTRIVSDDTP